MQAFVNRSDKSDLMANTGLDREVPQNVTEPDLANHDDVDGSNPDPIVHEHDGDDPSGVPDSQVTAALGEQLQEALVDKQKLADDLQLERDRNTQLENQIALGKPPFFYKNSFYKNHKLKYGFYFYC